MKQNCCTRIGYGKKKKFYDTDREAKPNSVNFSCDARWKTDNTLILLSDEACRHLGGYVNSE
jgi:hypothetical protein